MASNLDNSEILSIANKKNSFLIKTPNEVYRINIQELMELEELLDIDDSNLYNFYNGLDTEIKFKKNKINKLFKNFIYNK